MSTGMSKNFQLMETGIDITPFRKELEEYLAKGNTWATDRAQLIPEQRHTRHIYLRKHVVPSKILKTHTFEEQLKLMPNLNHHELNLFTYPFFKQTYDFVEAFADSIGGQLTKVQIVSLSPHSQIYRHIDRGNYYRDKKRYHLPIRTKGSRNICGKEEQTFNEGEIWYLNFHKYHEAFNDHDEERVHIIFDVLLKKRSLLRRIKDATEKRAALIRAAL